MNCYLLAEFYCSSKVRLIVYNSKNRISTNFHIR